jgi:hypothetical protein
MTLDKVLSKTFDENLKKHLLISFALTGGICLLIAATAGMFDYSAPVDAQFGNQGAEILRLDRISLARSSAWRSFILITLAAGVLYFSLTKKLSMNYGFGIITALLLGDLWFVGKRYLNYDTFSKSPSEELFGKSDADNTILKDNAPSYRVVNLLNPFNEAFTSYYHKSVGGYFAVKMRRYQDLIEVYLQNEVENSIKDLQSKGQVNFEEKKVLNMLNTKYFKFGNSAKNVLQNPAALGNAWFVQNIKIVNSPDEEIKALAEENLKSTAIIDQTKFKTSKNSFVNDSTSYIKLISYKPNELVYETNNANDGFAVFSEIWYPAWKAEIDGKAAEIKSVNYVLRGIEVPAGKHKIIFRFDSETFERGNLITMIASYVAVLTILAALVMEFLKSNRKEHES